MRSKKVTRYYCEYCKKGGFYGPRMEKHEQGCTKNPSRVCGLCATAGEEQQTMDVLREALQKDIEADKPNGSFEIEITNLRSVASNCPACITAAIRLAAVQIYFDFNIQKEFASFWQEVNEARERCY